MHKRLCFLLPDIDTAENIVNELREVGIVEKHIHVVAKNEYDITQHKLPQATLWEKTDLLPSIERGLLLGGTTGIIAGLTALALPSVNFILGGGAVLGIGAIGAGFGAWASSMIGVSVPNKIIENFARQIEQNEVILVMVDLPNEAEKSVLEVIKNHHPEAEIHSFNI